MFVVCNIVLTYTFTELCLIDASLSEFYALFHMHIAAVLGLFDFHADSQVYVSVKHAVQLWCRQSFLSRSPCCIRRALVSRKPFKCCSSSCVHGEQCNELRACTVGVRFIRQRVQMHADRQTCAAVSYNIDITGLSDCRFHVFRNL